MPKHQASRSGYTQAVGAALIALAFLIGVSLFPHQSAPAPRFVAARGGQVFGLGVWLLPFLCLAVGLIILVRRSFALSGRVWGLLSAYVVMLVVLHLRYPAGRELLAASGRKGGGYLGALLTLVLRRVTGEPGLWVATVGGAVAAIVLLWGLSLDDLGRLGLTVFLAGGRAAARAARTVAAWFGGLLVWLGRAAVWLVLMTLAGLRAAGRLVWRTVAAVPPILRRGAVWAAGAASTAVRRLAERSRAFRASTAPPLVPATLSAASPAAVQSLASVAVTPALAVTGPAPAARADEPSALSLDSGEDAESPGDGLLEEATAELEVPGELVPAEAPAAESGAAETPTASGAPPETPAGPKRAKRRRSNVTQEALPFPAEPRRAYVVPELSLLDAFAAKAKAGKVDPEEVARNLERTLASFGVEAKVVHWETGPAVTRYELQPAPGVKVQKITSLTNDIALSLAASSVRLEAPIPGKSAIGVELPNERPSLVHLREILGSDQFTHATSPLAVAVGKGIAGLPIVADLVQMPHLLIAGATGAGKSVALNAMIASILFRATPEHARFLMIDPKRVELTNYNGIPHLLSPVVTGAREAAAKLRWAIQEMESRYEMFAKDGVRNIQAFNAAHPDRPLAYILIIIDELADLMMVAPADFEEIICRLAQMTRATGMHLLVATQRPSVDVITGLIKANIPSRIAFSVSSQVDSRTILDHPGAEKLLGRGDMLFSPLGAIRPTRVQGAFISDAETERLVQFWRTQGEPAYVDALLQATADEAAEGGGNNADALLADAARLVVRAGYASVSLLQRKMRIGYVRAARLVDQMEEKGIVGPSQGSSPRELLVGLDELERVLRAGGPPGGGLAGQHEIKAGSAEPARFDVMVAGRGSAGTGAGSAEGAS
ncbi:MAG: FtsK/SpoIIIE family DNA translocase [bacterium]